MADPLSQTPSARLCDGLLPLSLPFKRLYRPGTRFSDDLVETLPTPPAFLRPLTPAAGRLEHFPRRGSMLRSPVTPALLLLHLLLLPLALLPAAAAAAVVRSAELVPLTLLDGSEPALSAAEWDRATNLNTATAETPDGVSVYAVSSDDVSATDSRLTVWSRPSRDSTELTLVQSLGIDDVAPGYRVTTLQPWSHVAATDRHVLLYGRGQKPDGFRCIAVSLARNASDDGRLAPASVVEPFVAAGGALDVFGNVRAQGFSLAPGGGEVLAGRAVVSTSTVPKAAGAADGTSPLHVALMSFDDSTGAFGAPRVNSPTADSFLAEPHGVSSVAWSPDVSTAYVGTWAERKSLSSGATVDVTPFVVVLDAAATLAGPSGVTVLEEVSLPAQTALRYGTAVWVPPTGGGGLLYTSFAPDYQNIEGATRPLDGAVSGMDTFDACFYWRAANGTGGGGALSDFAAASCVYEPAAGLYLGAGSGAPTQDFLGGSGGGGLPTVRGAPGAIADLPVVLRSVTGTTLTADAFDTLVWEAALPAVLRFDAGAAADGSAATLTRLNEALPFAPVPTALSGTAAGGLLLAGDTIGAARVGAMLRVPLAAPAGLEASWSEATLTLRVGSDAAGNSVSVAGGGEPEEWSVFPPLPNGLTLSAATGALSGTAFAPAAAAAYRFEARNRAGSAALVRFLEVLPDDPPAFSYASSPATLQAGEAASLAPSPATSAAGLVYSVDPPLPAGLSLDSSTGVVSGRPAALDGAAGDSPLSFTVTLSLGAAGGAGDRTASLELTVVSPLVASYSPPGLAIMRVGDPAGAPALAVAGGGPLAAASTATPSLPAGLFVNSTTGAVGGVPTAAAAAAVYTVTARGADGEDALVPLRLEVLAAAPGALSYPDLPAAGELSVGDAVDALPSHAGGVGASSYRLEGAAAPEWLALDPDTGRLSGTPTEPWNPANAAGVRVVASSGGGGEVSAAVGELLAARAVAPAGLAYDRPDDVVEAGAEVPPNRPSLSGGGGPAESWSVSPAPSGGLTFSERTGTFAGTLALEHGDVTYTVTASNGGGNTAAAVRVSASAELAPDAVTYVPAAVRLELGGGDAAVAAPHVAGGADGLTFSVSPALPEGLEIDAGTGAISGTLGGGVAASPAARYTVRAEGARGTATGVLSIEVVPPAPRAFAFPPGAGALVAGGPAAGVAPVASDGTAADEAWDASTAWTVNPPLPAGLSLNASTGAIAGTPSAEVARAVYEVTATNAGGSAAAALLIEAPLPPPAFYYAGGSAWRLSAGVAALPRSPTLVDPAATLDGVEFEVRPPLAEAVPGLALDASTGQFSGTPTEAGATLLVVTARSSGGAAVFVLDLEVAGDSAPPAGLAYRGGGTFEFARGTAVAVPAPTLSGGAASSFSVEPALPSGMVFSETTGAVSGEAVAADPFGSAYVVTATNSAGSNTATLRVVVSDSTLLAASTADAIEGDFATESEVGEAQTTAQAAALCLILLLVALAVYCCFAARSRREASRKADASASEAAAAAMLAQSVAQNLSTAGHSSPRRRARDLESGDASSDYSEEPYEADEYEPSVSSRRSHRRTRSRQSSPRKRGPSHRRSGSGRPLAEARQSSSRQDLELARVGGGAKAAPEPAPRPAPAAVAAAAAPRKKGRQPREGRRAGEDEGGGEAGEEKEDAADAMAREYTDEQEREQIETVKSRQLRRDVEERLARAINERAQLRGGESNDGETDEDEFGTGTNAADYSDDSETGGTGPGGATA